MKRKADDDAAAAADSASDAASDALADAAKADDEEELDFDDDQAPAAKEAADDDQAPAAKEAASPRAAAPTPSPRKEADGEAAQERASEGSRERSGSREAAGDKPRDLPADEEEEEEKAGAAEDDNEWWMLQVTFADEEAAKGFAHSPDCGGVDEMHAKAAKRLSSFRSEEVSQAADRVGPLHGNPPSVFFSSRAVAFVEAARQTHCLHTLATRFGGSGKLEFGDVGGGPGAWTEAVLYLVLQGAALPMRASAGIGMTSKGRDEWKIEHLQVTGARTLAGDFTFFGADGTGDCCVSNVRAFASAAKKKTAGAGLHLLLGGGEASGFKQKQARMLLAARTLVSILTLQEGGAAVLSIPDVASEYSAGALYILWYTFDKLTCVIPKVSRPSAVPTCVVVCEGRRGSPRFQGPRFGKQYAAAPPEPTAHLYRVLAALSGGAGIAALVDRSTLTNDTEFYSWYGETVVKTLRWRATALQRAEMALERSEKAERRFGRSSGPGLPDDRTPRERQEQAAASLSFLQMLGLPPRLAPPPLPPPTRGGWAGRSAGAAGVKRGAGWGGAPPAKTARH
eukprot:TRINITY_DN1830_c0_g1_i1.p1 TRINITY_DN1830_c0_g1~~TRINITY_DN1830_c0_g1_i1.p1  ORF type:complete len:568 (+),score=198.47 TRINITY_DN1830_c0_g1_i1:67-1770(+)